ncbi:hypothetical protein [Streptomyces sp. NPDC006355]|uniref:hypothetical protein n=1 Tax=Streptomyces sp. NPDC006355 TaxID=3156758 RepID=UPI0033BAC638
MNGQIIRPRVVEGTSVVMPAERQLAVGHWLLTAAEDREKALRQWDGQDVALLACGGIFSAVRAPAALVWAAVGTEDLDDVDDRLRKWFDGGAVFMDLHGLHYYALVPGSTASRWRERDYPGVACLGRDHYLGVPAARSVERRGRAYWCVPMDSPGDLCYVDEVTELLRTGQAARREGGTP